MGLNDHPFLFGRGAGISKRLDENACLTVIFVECGGSRWAERSRTDFLAFLMKSISTVSQVMPGRKLYHTQELVTLPASPGADPARSVLSALKLSSIPALAEARRSAASQRYGVSFSYAPLLFVLNSRGRSFTAARRKPGDSQDEYSVLYLGEPGFSSRSIARAVLCQFGAVDYTGDPELLALAKKHFLRGIMLDREGTVDFLDSLNAYLVGRLDALDRVARDFLTESEPVARRLTGTAAVSAAKSAGGTAKTAGSTAKTSGSTAKSAGSAAKTSGSTAKASGSTTKTAGTAKSAGGAAKASGSTTKATGTAKTASKAKRSGIQGPARHFRHVYISGKDAGSTLRLKGNVKILHYFCDHEASQWTAQAREEYKAAAEEARQMILSQAKKWKVDLSVTNVYTDISLKGDLSPDVLVKALHAIRVNSVPEFKRYCSLYLSCEETPIVLAFNEVYRSFARKADDVNPGWQELSVIYRDRASNGGRFRADTIVHELFHQFGAPDYYYPEETKKAAKAYLPGSIMSGGTAIDDLTAYLIGWTTTLSENALQFLDATAHMTVESARAARVAENSKTKDIYGK